MLVQQRSHALRFWRRLGAVLALLVLLTPAAGAGSRYFYCVSQGSVHRAQCCPGAAASPGVQRSSAQGVERLERRCCIEHVVPVSTGGVAYFAALALPAPRLDVWQDAWIPDFQRPPLERAEASDWPIRAGPARASERCAALQVFLI